MKAVTNIADRRVSWVKARPLNCDIKLKEDERCPNCKQVHLRAGYCQALDPINKDQYPDVWKSVTVSAVTDNSVTDKICVVCNEPFEAKRADATICSAACRMRKKRAEAKA